MKSIYRLVCLLCIIPFTGLAQYAPQAGLPGSSAIFGTSSLFVGWANNCTIQRGYMNIADTSLGLATSGDSSLAIGSADGSVVSLGDSGIATLTFPHPIFDGPGPDFAVFENGFINPLDSTMAFLELGFVEVSSDGIYYFRFPANSLTQDNVQIPMAGVYMDASKINNLAGKYIGGWGTPFDLAELAGKPGLDINHVTHVRVIDVIGAISGHTTKDSAGRNINDPYPTAIPTGGFDLDAVGVINQLGTGIQELNDNASVNVYPNPANDLITISFEDNYTKDFKAVLTNATGYVLIQSGLSNKINSLSVNSYPAGIYLLTIYNPNGAKWLKKITKY